MAGNSNLHKASAAKNDEFFTQLTDIERELRHYKEHFKDKVVFCNCDDPLYSNFWQYFQRNFHFLQLKKLVATHYEAGKTSYKMEIIRTEKGAQMGIPDYVQTALTGDGDFRSDECIEILKEADIVVTNPPFSLFREYVLQLIDFEKRFVIIGNKNAITYKEFFPLLKSNKVWIGYEQPSKFMDANGEITNQVQGLCRWFTNLDIPKRHEEVLLYKSYTAEEYPTYDNYSAINVNKVQDIPCDYFEIMGVPITFMDKYSPEQFEIVGLDRYVEDNPKYGHRFTILGKETYARILIRRKTNEN